jgi:hypothetical protein
MDEHEARIEAEEEARHTMGAVPWILEAAIIAPVFLCIVAILVRLLR